MTPTSSAILNLFFQRQKYPFIRRLLLQARWRSLGLLLVLGLGFPMLGCTTTSSRPANPPATAEATAPAPADAAQVDTATTLSSLKFKQGNGDNAFSLKLKANGAKLVDPADGELARLTVDEAQKVKIKDAQDNTLGYVVKTGDHWKIKNAEQSETLYVLRRQADGDYKLEDGQDQQIYRIKARDYGYEIETPAKQSLYKVKLKEGKTSLRNAQDETVLSTKDAIATIAVAAFGLEVLTPAQQAALAYAVNLTGGQ
jgi:hypothetical protein